jgi:hypothetical protein
MEYYLSFKNRNSIICDNMDETRGHDVKWNLQGTPNQILNDLTYM